MKKYLFSILVRGLLAFSGFMVFLVSAKLFGSEGRGIMSYGVSIFASLGLIFSFNFGRTFLIDTNRKQELKDNFLLSYLFLNFYSFFLTFFVGILFWTFSESAQKILDLKIIFSLSITSVYYVWLVNGNSIYAAFLKTALQDTIILTTRFLMLVFLISFLFFDIRDLSLFVLCYSIILTLGVLCEIVILLFVVKPKYDLFSRAQLLKTIKKSLMPHLDYLAFNCYPLLLVVISGWYLDKSQIGRVNFALQLINLVFLFSTTANIKLSSYISDVGIHERKKQFKKLLKYTGLLSFCAVIFLYYGLKYLTKTSYFSSFQDVEQLFLLASFSVPGYMLYQFLSPIWLELKWIKLSAFLNLFFLFCVLLISPLILKQWQENGMVVLFSLFHCCLFLSQLILLAKYKKIN